MASLDSAICPHLRTQRTLPLSAPSTFSPPVPAFSARFSPSVTELVTLIIGAQATSTTSPLHPSTLSPITSFLSNPTTTPPGHTVLCSSHDTSGLENRAIIAYWPSRAHLDKWRTSSGFDAWWNSSEREADSNGWFLEILVPSLDRYETVFSHDGETSREGASLLEGAYTGFSGPIREHAYWGSAGDRFAVTQTEKVEGETWRGRVGEVDGEGLGKRVRVRPRRNLCVIRSGQNWADLDGEEREMYLGTIHPTLIKGMDYLRDNGQQVGCFDCRFMANIDEKTLQPTGDKTFGLAYFDNLASLQTWAKHHRTHLDIWGRFMKYAQDLQGNVRLKLFHEIVVLEPEQQFFEYIGCRLGTGMLDAAEGNTQAEEVFAQPTASL